MARCPECSTKLVMSSDVQRWDRLVCTNCGKTLEVRNLVPLELEAVLDAGDEDDVLASLEEDDDDGDWEEEEDDGLDEDGDGDEEEW